MWRRLQSASRTTLAMIAGVTAIILFVAVNLVTSLALDATRVDLTEDKFFTVSDTTRDILEGVEQPVTLRFYISSALVEETPPLRVHVARVDELLRAYERLSGGLVSVEEIDPVPFSPEEDKAIGYNLVGFNLSRAGEQGYIGLVGTNSVDQIEVIEALVPGQAAVLEFELTRMVARLSSPTEPRIGVIDGLGLFGSAALGRLPAALIDRMGLDYELVQIGADTTAIQDDLDALVIIHPHNITESALYAVDQYVIRGRPLLVFLDAVAEHSPPSPNNPAVPQFPDSYLEPLMTAWGLNMIPELVVGDLNMGIEVRGAAGQQVIFSQYPPWLLVSADNLADDVVTSQLTLMRMSSAGALVPIDGATTVFTPLIETTENSMLYEQATILRRFDPTQLVATFEPSGIRQVMAARLTGTVQTAFPDGPPPVPEPGAEEEAPPDPPELIAQSDRPISVIVVSDTDMLTDDLNVSQTGGASTQNIDFIVNSIDNLTGEGRLIGLRGRGLTYRPFTRVDEIEADADAEYRATEQLLQAELEDTQDRLAELQAQALTPDGQIGAISREQQETINEFNQRILEVREELREVQGALRQEIDALANQLRLINILAVPAVIIVIGIMVAVWRRIRLGRYLRGRQATA